jgi:hypothetical protein
MTSLFGLHIPFVLMFFMFTLIFVVAAGMLGRR